MAGTREGGIRTRDKNLAKDPEWYAKIGAIGGSKSNTGGFAYWKINGMEDKIREAGRLGGSMRKGRKYASN